ncbi:MAG TPA: metallophosphoesterase [Pyrinomonadaceae bacterium]|nr:metallophosphoesterase [Pyrinomonadaceae bacterium]
MPEFKELTNKEAYDLFKTNSAFRGDIADWLFEEPALPDAKVFEVKLPPVNMHRKVGPIKLKTRLDFFSSAPRFSALRFKDSKKQPSQCKLEELGEEAVILVVKPSAQVPDGVDIRVEASGVGKLIDANNLGKGERGTCVFIWRFKVIDCADMVGWYDPGQLAQTAVGVAISTIFGRNADYRVTESLAAISNDADGDKEPEPLVDGFFDYSGHDDLWIDYVADTGDGWNSTYSVAYHISQPQLQVAADMSIPRGHVLIFGGDEVYPTSSRPVYRQRLVDAYEAALPETDEPHPHAFAIPGNHDWYDSLVSFTRLFCQRRWFAGWKTRQSRSYFALKLPHKWWLIGTDVQLDSDIDFPQVEYFKKVASKMEKGDQIILCTAEPHWIYDKLLKKYDNQINENNLAFLEQKIFCDNTIQVYLSGDLHHYRRHAPVMGPGHKITAGGGGAFMHPTHGGDVTELRDGFHLQKSFPSRETSSRVSLKNLGFVFLNPKFGVLTAVLYTLTCWSVMAPIGRFGVREFWPVFKTVIATAVISPIAVFWIALVFAGFLMFTDTYSKLYRWIAGPLHGIAHLAATFFIGWFATYLGVSVFHLRFGSVWQLLIAAAVIVTLGWIVGSTVMGIYLLISLNGFARHANEAFSALAIQDWKNFLRLNIDSHGYLVIYPIGIRRIARKWKRSEDSTGSLVLPNDKKATSPGMIEEFIVISPKVTDSSWSPPPKQWIFVED